MSETDLVRVLSVTSGETRQPGLRQFIITTVKVARPDMCLQVQTVNDIAASLCQRAKDLNRPIALTHARTKYGRTLTAAHFLKVEAA